MIKKNFMKLVKIGKVILNMENILAVKESNGEIILFFTGSSSEKVLSITLEGENALQMLAWLNRNGVNDFSTESPTWNW